MFKPFDKLDWDGMAGATPFADGAEPLVDYEVTVDGLEAIAVIDANGFYLQILTPDGDTVSELFSDAGNTVGIFRFLAGNTPNRAWSTGELADMGIEPRRAD